MSELVKMLATPDITVLGQDSSPTRVHRINANSFQQNAITTAGKWQYAALYVARNHHENDNALYVMMARRRVDVESKDWETFVFDDYAQTTDDGHNTISIAVCKGDWTIHLAFDHHCDQLRFRISEPMAQGGFETWDQNLFSPTLDHLPGMANLSSDESEGKFGNVTYPRFINFQDTAVKQKDSSLPDEDLMFTHRIGQPGEGSDVLYRYSSITHTYQYMGLLLEGILNNPYINGFDFRLGKFHVSWCYREFHEMTSAELQKFHAENPHKGQVGPNGPENNQGLFYSYSDTFGRTWKNTRGEPIAQMGVSGAKETSSIRPTSDGARIFDIPKGSGILNQESQVADCEGGFHVLNREKRDGREQWMHYYRSPDGEWSRRPITAPSAPTETGARGTLCADRRNNVYFILPGNIEGDSSLTILRGGCSDGFRSLRTAWQGKGFDGEPLVDVQRLEETDIMSVFTRTDKGDDGLRQVVVLDFDVGEN